MCLVIGDGILRQREEGKVCAFSVSGGKEELSVREITDSFGCYK